MKNPNNKNALGRKAATVVALTAAMAATVASSPASAYQRYSTQGALINKHGEKFLGHGNTKAKALADALNGARCLFGRELQRSAPTYTVMYNNTWWNATVTFTCSGIPVGE
ncbi:hypothetical protein [Pseudoduganella namucuonensis]|uniref:Uncharacterized protein n=1 Tax=Pseudoduganella namucuonensis TaxID=1035707 RepID=A0A1I7LW04_9BURK|nr:hypothetical protein [Pseudoduganella namucuonensis]SFV13888.1 hypothetical protein SAMN05216552_104034 [Pseudoduganella namucuonensis]